MTDAHSLTPFPNPILFNWATIFVLGFGNLAGESETEVMYSFL